MRGPNHGWSKTKLAFVWSGMKARCYNAKHSSFPDYGGRGIIVCDEWQEFWRFKNWALSSGYREGLTIERSDNNDNYTPKNCYWATRKEQNRNSRHNRLVTAFGETKSVIEWTEDKRCKTTYTGLRKRLNRGWKAEKAITTYPRENQFS